MSGDVQHFGTFAKTYIQKKLNPFFFSTMSTIDSGIDMCVFSGFLWLLPCCHPFFLVFAVLCVFFLCILDVTTGVLCCLRCVLRCLLVFSSCAPLFFFLCSLVFVVWSLLVFAFSVVFCVVFLVFFVCVPWLCCSSLLLSFIQSLVCFVFSLVCCVCVCSLACFVVFQCSLCVFLELVVFSLLFSVFSFLFLVFSLAFFVFSLTFLVSSLSFLSFLPQCSLFPPWCSLRSPSMFIIFSLVFLHFRLCFLCVLPSCSLVVLCFLCVALFHPDSNARSMLVNSRTHLHYQVRSSGSQVYVETGTTAHSPSRCSDVLPPSRMSSANNVLAQEPSLRPSSCRRARRKDLAKAKDSAFSGLSCCLQESPTQFSIRSNHGKTQQTLYLAPRSANQDVPLDDG